MKLLIFTLALTSARLFGQTFVPAPIGPSASAPIPKHLIYQHFLSMVSDLDAKAIATGATDPYQYDEGRWG